MVARMSRLETALGARGGAGRPRRLRHAARRACADSRLPLRPPPRPRRRRRSEKPLPPPKPAPDPIVALIAESQARFDAGQRELAVGHLERARREFDAAIDVLVQSPYGARYDARLREHFERLIDRISAYEMTALAEGDGFTEKRYEPASIDALLEESTFATVAASAKTEEIVASDLERTPHDVPIPLNERVLAYVELFQGRLREWFQAGLQRGAQYLPMIQDVFRAEGLPLDLAYVPLIESAFKPNALSRAKAKGVWQFMAATGSRERTQTRLVRRRAVRPREGHPRGGSVPPDAVARLRRRLAPRAGVVQRRPGAGPARDERAMASTISGSWPRSATAFPRETREYVPMMLAAMVIARNPVQYGFDVAPVAPLEYDKVKVHQPVDLRRDRRVGRHDRRRHPGAEPGAAAVDDARSAPWPRGLRNQGARRAAARRSNPGSPSCLRPTPPPLKWYTVKRGDTLTTIAKKLRVNRVDLADANYLSARSVVTPGQNLVIPVEPSRLLARGPERASPAAASRAGAAAVKPAPPKAGARGSRPKPSR